MAFATAFIGILLVVSVLGLISTVLSVIGTWKILEKAGENGWKSLIPFYSGYMLYKISWDVRPYWIMLGCTIINFVLTRINDLFLFLNPLFSLVITGIFVIQLYKLSKAFGHGIGFTIGLFLLNPLFVFILGLDSSTYQGPQ